MQHDFPSDLLDRVAHRPWPVPSGPWIMTQSWHDLLFAHWPVDARALREKIPPGFDLDLFDGQAWIGVIPFHMTNVAPRGVPAIPYVSAFNELNVRTYVTMDDKPGIYFFSLDADSRVAVTAARTLFKLPYYVAEMAHDTRDGEVTYCSRRTSGHEPAEWRGRYRATGSARPAERGTLDYFLTERYCLYTVDEEFRAYRLEIHHPAWPLQPAEAEIEIDTMVDAAGLRRAAVAPLLHFAKRQDMLAWPLARIGSNA